MKKKFPYVSCTEKELRDMERNSYVIYLGGDFLVYDGYNSFSKKEVESIYEETLSDILSVIHKGSEKDRQYALKILGTLRVGSMRMH
jgi:hypothetical protein